jgi:predicted lactoylglutathione lyase
MAKELWINLPVKDVQKSKDFFTKLGFKFNPGLSRGDESACLVIGSNNVIVMLFAEPTFKNFTSTEIAETKSVSEVLFSIGAESREEVDEMANKALKAGGSIFGKPKETQGWMYGCGFADLDGHRWNMLYMDMNAMPR